MVDGVLIGLAADRADVRSRLRDALSGVLADEQAEHNFTVSVATDAARFHRLLWGGCAVVRTLDPARLVRALEQHLGGHGPTPAGVLRTDAVAVVRVADGRAFLLPPAMRQSLAFFERALRQRGFLFTDAPSADIDVAAGEILLGAPSLPETQLEALLRLAPPTKRADPVLASGRYPIAAWLLPSFGQVGVTPSRAVAVAGLLARPGPGTTLWPTVAHDLGELFARVERHWYNAASASELAAWLAAQP